MNCKLKGMDRERLYAPFGGLHAEFTGGWTAICEYPTVSVNDVWTPKDRAYLLEDSVLKNLGSVVSYGATLRVRLSLWSDLMSNTYRI